MNRRVLLVTHTGRPEALAAASEISEALMGAGIEVAVLPQEADELHELLGPHGLQRHLGDVEIADPEHLAEGCELVIVLGGDGTILRGAEIVRGTSVPLLGVNLGHVGFLAEIEREDIRETVHRVVSRDYTVEERLTLDVTVRCGGEVIHRCWALNEATVEKAARERMLEVVIEVDGRPLSTIGCDGVVMATPTGSTAYSFSAGGPVVWPQVEALLLVPISAHALFARPLVVGPQSQLAVEVLGDTEGSGVLWCDGRRRYELGPGSRIEAVRSELPVRLARLAPGPFTDRLVAKFRLPVHGWRGQRRPAS
ncbi:NAD kinase [Angustibacter sp. Root456]|uniref:NAD kinase n=1 Tax=Angustibacter sp. Root456 TaxID=1736539 RepID=UPI0006F62127|nr:NAD kinase [Angustibacter sp. Root456]KQX66822.1 NAD kinase [Angustibacter sp. Root456]